VGDVLLADIMKSVKLILITLQNWQYIVFVLFLYINVLVIFEEKVTNVLLTVAYYTQ